MFFRDALLLEELGSISRLPSSARPESHSEWTTGEITAAPASRMSTVPDSYYAPQEDGSQLAAIPSRSADAVAVTCVP